ncbi:uncharacterized protein K02A2.6-like [Ruditapes philippinarum]|uniref:uncharacterized protein K02A2.6-like n=1 Tax=Ruditapes philippinarum TaxID=129788 RepID=UPI00295A6619|nr:uncharacterized protein K02A2.6-like [Ruditapes philippinarum]
MYAQVQREATAIYWAVHKYYPYLYGRKFTLITDCQALLSIFSPSKGIPATSAARIQRYAVYLSGFDYDIEYKNTKKHTNVDGMSRLPAPSILENESNFEEVFFNEQFDKLPITSAQIKRETQREPILSRVYENVNKGWSLNLNDPVLKGYHTRRNELTIQRGCLMWGIRVVIPEKLRGQVLDLLHCSHSGIVKMKNLARSYVWWPGIDSDIEHMVRQCQGCQMQQKMPEKVQLHPWENARSNFERVHVDFVGLFQGHMFLVIVCARSKWAEIEDLGNCTSAEKTVNVLRTIFSRYGIPKQLVSDNGVQFTELFAQFMKNNGIFHIRTAVAKPSTNGLVERLNGTFKSRIRAMKFDKGDLNLKLANFLLTYRNSVHQSTQESPAMMFMGRSLRSKLDLLKPDIDGYVEKQRMKLATSESRNFREFKEGDSIIARDYRPTSTEKMVIGTILSREGPLMYKIDIGNNQV